jgi:broad specificity phosphatase PhoE
MFVLLRHAHAVNKRAWSGRDEERPLSERGFREAEALVESLLAVPLRRLLSSPALRCRQTLDPLARRLGVAIEPTDLLDRDVDAPRVAALAEDPGSIDAVLCTHGETLVALLGHWQACGRIVLTPPTGKIIKGTTPKSGGWLVHGGAQLQARYLPPPRLSGIKTAPADEKRPGRGPA